MPRRCAMRGMVGERWGHAVNTRPSPLGVQAGCPQELSAGPSRHWTCLLSMSSTNTPGGRLPTRRSPQSSCQAPTPRQVGGAACTDSAAGPPKAGVRSGAGVCVVGRVGQRQGRTTTRYTFTAPLQRRLPGVSAPWCTTQRQFPPSHHSRGLHAGPWAPAT